MEVDERWPTKKRGMNSKSPPASTVRKVSFRDQFCSLLESKQEFSPASKSSSTRFFAQTKYVHEMSVKNVLYRIAPTKRDEPILTRFSKNDGPKTQECIKVVL